MPFSVARSFSEAELMSISSAFFSSFFGSALGVSVFLASVFGASAFWAMADPAARPNAARVITSNLKILCMLQFLRGFVVWYLPLNGRLSLPVDGKGKSPAEAGLFWGLTPVFTRSSVGGARSPRAEQLRSARRDRTSP